MFKPGDRLGDYEILARLKAGGMATLYIARRSGAAGFSIPVAIKVVHPDLAGDRSFVDMFVAEAHLSARIRHPNVVHVEELKEVDGRLMLVMEYVAGSSLSVLLRQLAKLKRRLSPPLAAFIAIKVAEGLHAAHETKDDLQQPLHVVHRDVSPSNILMAWQGHVKLIDFGIAKTKSSVKTQAKSLKGKLRYMSPEQARSSDIDRRTDVYALGIVLWEMLTMRRLFSAESDILLLNQVRDPEIEAPSVHAKGIDPALDRVVLKALAPNPDERYQTAKDLRRDLARAIPDALALDSERVSELLQVVLAEEIDKQRAKLSGIVTETTGPHATDESEALQTMTLAASEIEAFDDETRSTRSTPIEAGPFESAEEFETVVFDHGDSPEPAPTQISPAAPSLGAPHADLADPVPAIDDSEWAAATIATPPPNVGGDPYATAMRRSAARRLLPLGVAAAVLLVGGLGALAFGGDDPAPLEVDAAPRTSHPPRADDRDEIDAGLPVPGSAVEVVSMTESPWATRADEAGDRGEPPARANDGEDTTDEEVVEPPPRTSPMSATMSRSSRMRRRATMLREHRNSRGRRVPIAEDFGF